MGFYDDELSVETSQPREYYRIQHGFDSSGNAATVYRLASGDRDVTYNGETFTATPVARGEWLVSPITGDVDFVLTLPANHALARRYVAVGGVPPQQVLVTVYRIQLNSMQPIQVWMGYVTSLAFEDHVAKFRVPSRTQQSMLRRLPIRTVRTDCPYVLFDSQCGLSRAAYQCLAGTTFVDGRTVWVNTVNSNPDQYYRDGELVMTDTGERMTIVDQKGLVLTLQQPIAELKFGKAVTLYPGDDHQRSTCRSKFNNVANYGGLPDRPTRNPFMPGNAGAFETQ